SCSPSVARGRDAGNMKNAATITFLRGGGVVAVMKARNSGGPLLPRVLVAVAAALLAGASVHAQEKNADFLPREDMVDAIIRYAASSGCDMRRNLFGADLAARCSKPDADDDEQMDMWLHLDRLSDRDLIELCRSNMIVDCERPREVSKGRGILTFESAF